MKSPGALSFAEYIKMLPSTWIFEHFLKNNSGERKILSSSIVSNTVQEFSTAASLIAQFESLPQDRQISCILTYLFGNSGLPATDEGGLDDPLVRSFLVYQGKNEAGHVRYFGFDEFEPHLRSTFASYFAGIAKVNETAEPNPVSPWRSLNDVTVVVALASQGLLKRKQGTGTLLRTGSLALKKLIHDASTRADTSDFVSKMLIAYGLKSEILTEEDFDYTVNNACFERWLHSPAAYRYHELLSFVIQYSGGWRLDLLQHILDTAKGFWLTSSVFPEIVQKSALDTLKALRFAGRIELKKNGDGFIFTDAKITGEDQMSSTESQIVVMPDFTAIIPQEISPLQLFRFCQAGMLESLDRVYKGKIEKQVVTESLSRGTQSDNLIEWLEIWHAPSNVMETIREWIREFSRLYISTRDMLLCFDEKVARQLNSYEPIFSLLEPVRAQAIYRIRQGREEELREMLNKLGFDTRMPGSDNECKEDESESMDEVTEERWIPVTDQAGKPQENVGTIRGTKYGAVLKQLDLSEIVHVIDYAILTGQQLIIDYEGSPYIKKNIYTILPLSFQKGVDPMIEAMLPKTKSRKQFYIRKIRKIGVVSK